MLLLWHNPSIVISHQPEWLQDHCSCTLNLHLLQIQKCVVRDVKYQSVAMRYEDGDGGFDGGGFFAEVGRIQKNDGQLLNFEINKYRGKESFKNSLVFLSKR